MKTIDEIMVAAYNFEQIPDYDLPAADCLLWYMLRDLYDRYKNKIITEQQGKDEKDKILRIYHNNVSDVEMAKKILLHNAEMWKNIEIASDNYRCNRTLDNADKVLEAIYQVGIKNTQKNGGDAYGIPRSV